MTSGRTIALYGDSGAGKTTQGGELAKWLYKRERKRTALYAADLGGFDSILPLVRLGVIQVILYDKDEDPFYWINQACEGFDKEGKALPDDIGLVIYDSATSMSEMLLQACAKLSANGEDIGGRPAPKFIINKRDISKQIKIGSNVDSHYLVVQSVMRDNMWRSTWLAREGRDVMWTFSTDRGEKADDTPILGPKLAGKALTAAVPKWFRYTFRIVSIPVVDSTPRHVLYLHEQSENNGTVTGFGNARYPLAAQTPLPECIEPASLITALEMIENGQEEADAVLREELGL